MPLILLENPSFISCDDLPKNIWITFNFLKHVFTKFDSVLLMVFQQNLGHHFGTHLLHPQIMQQDHWH